MNRRQFFITPLALLPAPAAAAGIPALVTTPTAQSVAAVAVGITVGPCMEMDAHWIDNILIPALRDAINNRDVKLINCSSRQARDLE